MMKPASLRAALTQAVPELATTPDKLLVFIDQGKVIATQAKSLSYEYDYRLNVIVTDYAGSADNLMVAVLAWAKRHQSELLNYPSANSLSFEVDHLNHQSCDIALTLPLTERVIVTTDAAGVPHIEHADEPLPDWGEA